MNALTPGNQVGQLEVLPQVLSKPPPEEVVDEITAWWQKTLGTKAVLGQASNRPVPGRRTPTRHLVWVKPDSRPAQQESPIIEETPPIAAEINGPTHRGTLDRKDHRWMNRILTAPGKLKEWSGVMVNGAVVFLAIGLLRSAGAVLLTFRTVLRRLHPTVG
jgi:hypothetical protein